MQPSKSVGPPPSSSSRSPPFAAAPWTIVVPAGHSPGPAAPAPPPTGGATVVVVVGFWVTPGGCGFDFEDAADAAELSLAETVTPTPSHPFIPTRAFPRTAHSHSYFPRF